jgi:hypothetical protein
MEDNKPKKAIKRAKELRWLDENEAYLEREYPGMWLAIEGEAIVGTGGTLQEAEAEAQAKGFGRPLLTAIRRKEYQGIPLIRVCRI